MKCSVCKSEIEEGSLYCSYCGKKVVNKKPYIIVGIWLGICFLLLVMGFVSLFKYMNSYEASPVGENVFLEKIEELECSVVNVLETNPNEEFSFYYVTDEVCPYKVAYAKIDDSDVRNGFYSTLLSEVEKVEGFARSYATVNLINYHDYTYIADNYRSATMAGEYVYYADTLKDNKDVMSELKKDLGINFKMDYSFSGYFVLLFITLGVLLIVSLWKIFKKMGHSGWLSLIPIYNIGCLSEDILGSMIYAIGLFLPIVNIIFLVALNLKIAKVFGKNDTVQVLAIFFPILVIPFIAFDDSKYKKIEDIKKENGTNNVRIPEKKEDTSIEVSVVEDKKSKFSNIVSNIVNVMKWILTIFFLVVGLTIFDPEYTISDIIVCVYFFIFALMACPLVTKYTKKCEKYTEKKGWIVVFLIVSMIIILSFFE